MSFIIDVILIVIALIIVLVSRKRGFFKTVISFVSFIASVLLAYAFTPNLSEYLYKNVFLTKLAGSIQGSLASVADDGAGLFDVSKLIGDDTFNQLVTRFGGDIGASNEYVSGISDKTSTAIEKISYHVADPLAQSISTVLAFVIIFVVAMVVLKIATKLLALVFKLPVLKEIDRTLGLVVGILCALLFVMIIVVFASNIGQLLEGLAPSMFSKDIVENSLIVSFFSKIHFIETISNTI